MRKLTLAGSPVPAGLTAVAIAAAVAMGTLSTSAMALSASMVPVTPAPAATPKPMSANPAIVDLGVADPAATKSFSIALVVRNQAAMDAAVAAVSDPTSPSFRKFITPAQFAAAYGQPASVIAQVTAFLQSQGFTIDDVAANGLLVNVTGSNAQIAATFGSAIHNYSLYGDTYQAPAGAATIPAAIASVATSVAGLSDRVFAYGHKAVIPNSGALAGDVPSQSVALSPDVAPASGSGSYTVLDLATKYDINPLYAKGVTGAGKTIGIATLAAYSQSDVYAYWSQIGLNVSQSRITDVKVGTGASKGYGVGTEGAGETTLDVEQSGGVAPGANIRVFVAPNTSSGFLKVFSQPINENMVDTLSISWGSPEATYDPASLPPFETLFKQAALQGIPIIASAGDAGAYDINRDYTYPQCTTELTVDFPAASPNVLAAGGTTLPNTTVHVHGPVTVSTERPWGWDYLQSYITTNYGPTYGSGLYYSQYFTVGGGGGVSTYYAVPTWQKGLTGVLTSAPGQSLTCDPTLFGLPAGQSVVGDIRPGGYAGRNVPDVSLNADPYSGYSEYFTGAWSVGGGGTSFVAPQLNGILTLIASGVGGRLGAINPQLYAAFKAKGYAAGSPFKAIVTGDNEYYKAAANFNPASGLGSLDVTALATYLGVK